MKALRRSWLLLVVVLVLVLVAAPARAADVDGKWSGSLDSPMGPVQMGFTFKADGATLSGTSTGPDGSEVAIKNGRLDGNKISFVVSVDFGGMAFDLNYTGVVSADNIQLTLDFMGMPMPFTVKKTN
jgi:opacity protein-like surface antigen